MRRVLLGGLLHVAVDAVSAWDLPSSSPPRYQKSTMDRRTVLRNNFLGTVGACVPSFSFAPDATAQAELGVTELSPPSMRSAAETTGVLWRTETGVALPATPKVVSQIMSKEVLGSLSTDSSGILCVSERHDDFEHHLIQLKVLMSMRKALQERSQNADQKLSIGMEMFQRQHQEFLDSYILAGANGGKDSNYSLDDLRRDTDWDNTWGYDILHYLPLLMFARKWGIRVIGLHPSDALVDSVSQVGLSSISPSIIEGVGTSDKKHWKGFQRDAYERISYDDFVSDFGGCTEAVEAKIQRQYEVQCFREEYMAESVARAVSDRPDGWVAILAGERHILGRNGIPFRALRRVTTNRNQRFSGSMTDVSNRGVFTIIPKTISYPLVAKEAPGIASADYIWYTQRDPSSKFQEDQVNLAPANLRLRSSA